MQVGEPHMLARAGAGGRMLGTSMGGDVASGFERGDEASDSLSPSSVACTILPHGVQIVGKGNRLVMACDDNTVISWSSTKESDLSKANKYHLKVFPQDRKVYKILAHMHLDAIVIIDNNFGLLLLSSDVKRELASSDMGVNKGAQIAHVSISPIKEGHGGSSLPESFFIVAIGINASGNAGLWRSRFSCSAEGSWSFNKAKFDALPPQEDTKDARIVSCSVHPGTTTLSILWDNQFWQQYRMAGSSANAKPTLKSSRKMRDLVGLEGSDKNEMSNTIIAGTSDYLVVVGRMRMRGKEPVGAKLCNVVRGYDLSYGTVQAEIELKWNAQDDDMSDSSSFVRCFFVPPLFSHLLAQRILDAKINADGSVLTISSDKCVLSCAIRSAPMSLELVLGKEINEKELEPPISFRPVNVITCSSFASCSSSLSSALTFVTSHLETTLTLFSFCQILSCVVGVEEEDKKGEATTSDLALEAVGRAVKEGNRREGAVLEELSSMSE
eukprot:347291-Hanusia_phi.AAC.2